MEPKPSRVFLTPADQTSDVPQRSLVPSPSKPKDTYFFVPAPTDYEKDGLDFNMLASDILANTMVESGGREDIDVSQGAILKWPKALKRHKVNTGIGVSNDRSVDARSKPQTGRYIPTYPAQYRKHSSLTVTRNTSNQRQLLI